MMKNLMLGLPTPASILMFCFFANAQQPGPEVGHHVNISSSINTDDVAEPLNHLVNTPFEELGPVLSHDGKRIYFSRQGYPGNTGGKNDEDIWFSEFDEVSQSWKKAINIGRPLNNKGHNFITGISMRDDTVMLGNVYGRKGKMTSGVSLSWKIGNLWATPVPIKIESDYNISEQSAFDLSPDRTVLLIAQEKVDAVGKLDLYASFRDPDATYPYSGTESINLGPIVNTFGNETSPWIAPDGVTLYFASDGHNGYGGLDIFVTKRLDNTWTNWTEPLNLGPGINSYYDDFSFSFNLESRYAYFVRGISPRNTDIFRVDMTHLFTDFKLPGEQLKENDNPVQVGERDEIQNVFVENSSEINPGAVSDLQYIVRYLKLYPKAVILIYTHSNIHGTREESHLLSNQRSLAIVNYLVENDIDKDRISYSGLGHDIAANAGDRSEEIASSVEFELIGFMK